MTNSHPITPPPELIEKWANNSASIHRQNGTYKQHEASIATQAARWGADIELEACCEWLEYADEKEKLRAARRLKMLSLKEQALAELDLLKGDAKAHGLGFDAPAIRRALEQLPD